MSRVQTPSIDFCGPMIRAIRSGMKQRRSSVRSRSIRFRHLWESINGPDSWDANPWVWVVEFKQKECN